MHENEILKIVVDICFKIHKQYGAGLFETVYEEIFCYEYKKLDLKFVRQKGVKLIHEGIDMGIGFVPDIIVCDKLIIEFKSVESLAEVHYKQLMTYLSITNLRLGLLINFNVPLIKNGINRVVNNLLELQVSRKAKKIKTKAKKTFCTLCFPLRLCMR